MDEQSRKPRILSVDDNPDNLMLVERFLKDTDYDLVKADSGQKALEEVSKAAPDIILLDIMMPDMNGYEVCSRLQEKSETSYIPVIFLTALNEKQDRARAFAVGAADYLVKPIKKEILIEKINTHLKTASAWEGLPEKAASQLGEKAARTDILGFKDSLAEKLSLSDESRDKLNNAAQSEIYSISYDIGATHHQIAKHLAEFLELSYTFNIDPKEIRLGVLPPPFCRANLVVPITDTSGELAYIISNPFDYELIELLKKISAGPKLVIAEPERIRTVVIGEKIPGSEESAQEAGMHRTYVAARGEAGPEQNQIIGASDRIMSAAVFERASDIHMESKEVDMVVRFRIDGEMRDFEHINKEMGLMLLSRLKAIAGLDIAEKRRPQDGAFDAVIGNRAFKLRLATTSTPNGESLILRLLEAGTRPKSLEELGMTDEQVAMMEGFAGRKQGLILFVGPTGSGKTTTIYSLLGQIDCKTNSLITVEDPVEYRIPFASQQEVNEKAGITFESLLRSTVRQDPDILVLGEVRDNYSAKMLVDFSSTGHLTITTMHTANATTAIFRLERLGIGRGVMADTILGIVAQRLVKKPCAFCKRIEPPTREEIDTLSSVTTDVPLQVVHPTGCPKCNNTGYFGRTGLYEIIRFTPELADVVRSGAPVSEIRRFARDSGVYLMSQHALQKIVDHTLCPGEVYEKILAEDVEQQDNRDPTGRTGLEKKPTGAHSILVVEDDTDTRNLIARFLEGAGYRITLVNDGIDAILSFGKIEFDLILSDVNMPNLDGFKLIEMMNQKGIEGPVIFLTSRSGGGDELRGLELGAVDYIRKPVKKEILLARVKKILAKGGRAAG